MPRQPVSGVGAAVRSPSGEAARAPAPSASSPLPPERYRALRARYNALLVTLYERSTLTLRELAAAAGCTQRAVHYLVRALGCQPRYARKGRCGATIGARRPGASPPPLNAPATRRLTAAFAAVARELAAYTEARRRPICSAPPARAMRRAARAQARVMTSAARELGHLATVFENAAAARDALAGGRRRKLKHSRAGKAAEAAKPRARAATWEAQERTMREQEARMRAAHVAARRAEAARPAAPAPAADAAAEAERRIDAIAERYYAKPRPGPRIRGL